MLIHQAIQRLFDEKFTTKIEKISKKVKEEEGDFAEFFNMKAKIVKEFQDLV